MNPITVHSPFQVSSRDDNGNLSTRLVVFLGDSKNELQATLEGLKFFFDDIAIYPENLEYTCKKLNFDDIITDLENGKFNFTAIPSFIKKVDQPLDPEDGGNKRRKTRNYEENDTKDTELILSNPKDYNTYFGGKLGAPVNECARYQLKGHCFSDCKKEKFHRKITDQGKKDMMKFCKQYMP